MERKSLFGFQSALTLTSILLLISYGCGLYIDSYFSSEAYRLRLQNLLQGQSPQSGPPIQVQVQKTKLVLSHNSLPYLALRVEGVKISGSLGQCQGKDVVDVDSLLIPMHWSSIFRGRFVLGQVSGSMVTLKISEASLQCFAQHSSQQQLAHQVVSVALALPMMTVDALAQSREVIVGSIYLDELKIISGQQSAILANISVARLSSQNTEVSGVLKLGSSTLSALPISAVQIRITSEENKKSFSYTGRLREGEWRIAGDADESWSHGKVHLSVKNVPLNDVQEIMTTYFQMPHSKFATRAMWLSCEIDGQEVSRDLNSGEWSLTGCFVDGEIGRIQVQDHQWQGRNILGTPIAVDLERVSVEILLQSFGVLMTHRPLIKPGLLDARLTLESANRFLIQGKLREIDYLFSNESTRTLQRIRSVQLNGEFESSAKGQLQLSEFEIDGGEMRGGIVFDWNSPNLLSVEINIPKLVFAADTQKVVWRGQLGAAALNGKLRFEDGLPAKSEITVGLAESRGSFVAVKSADISLRRTTTGPWRVSVNLNQATVSADSILQIWLKKLLKMPEPKAVAFKSAVGLIEIFDTKKVLWQKVNLMADNGAFLILSNGQIDANQNLNGRLEFRSAVPSFWRISGKQSQPQLDAAQ